MSSFLETLNKKSIELINPQLFLMTLFVLPSFLRDADFGLKKMTLEYNTPTLYKTKLT